MRACSSPARWLAAAGLGLATLALGACTSASGDMSPVTVTVYPTETASGATPIPTEYAGSPSDGTGVSRSAGPLKGAPSGFADAMGRLDRAKTSDTVQGFFVSPSGNIFCNVIQDGSTMACELAQGRIDAPADCPPGGPTQVRRLELGGDRVTVACDGTIRKSDPKPPTLPYGSKTIVAGTPVECLSETAGVTCVDTSGHRGFFVAKGTFETF